MSASTLWRWCLAAALLPVLCVPAVAQREQRFDEGEFYIEGVFAYCGAIQTVVKPEAPDLIVAPNYFTIEINGPAFDALPPGVRLFVYFQTCGTIFYGPDNLSSADASAARAGIANRWLSVADYEVICESDRLVEAGWSVAPDAARCDVIRETMQTMARR